MDGSGRDWQGIGVCLTVQQCAFEICDAASGTQLLKNRLHVLRHLVTAGRYGRANCTNLAVHVSRVLAHSRTDCAKVIRTDQRVQFGLCSSNIAGQCRAAVLQLNQKVIQCLA